MGFFTLIILVILISLFNRLLEGISNEQKRRQESYQKNDHVTNDEFIKDFEVFYEDLPQEEDLQLAEEDQFSLEEQREKQLEQLATRMDTHLDSEPIDEEISKSNPSVVTTNTSEIPEVKRKQMKGRIQKRLNRDGLIDSVIMAEVLSKPRALKPYQNILTRR